MAALPRRKEAKQAIMTRIRRHSRCRFWSSATLSTSAAGGAAEISTPPTIMGPSTALPSSLSCFQKELLLSPAKYPKRPMVRLPYTPVDSTMLLRPWRRSVAVCDKSEQRAASSEQRAVRIFFFSKKLTSYGQNHGTPLNRVSNCGDGTGATERTAPARWRREA